jgi:cytidine deaminase
MTSKEIKIEYSAYQSTDEFPAFALELLKEAISALDSAYSPYSQFQVGAALRLSNGKTVKGSNQENAAYPSGLCAERTAIYFAGAEYPNETIEGLVVVARKQGESHLVPACPCGGCRQAMLEYEERQKKSIPLFFKRTENEWVGVPSVASLLPFKFDSTSL